MVKDKPEKPPLIVWYEDKESFGLSPQVSAMLDRCVMVDPECVPVPKQAIEFVLDLMRDDGAGPIPREKARAAIFSLAFIYAWWSEFHEKPPTKLDS